MATDHILALLISERDKLTGAIEALQGTSKEKTPVSPSVDPTPPARAKRKMSAAGKRAIIAATQKRWAAVKAAKAAAETPAPVAKAPKAAPKKAPAVKKGGLTEAGRKALSIAMKQRWAAKKKAAAKGKAA
jgi:hypothetical protein